MNNSNSIANNFRDSITDSNNKNSNENNINSLIVTHNARLRCL